MFEIRKFNKIAKVGLDLFCGDFATADDFADPDGILVRSAALHDYAMNPKLLGIARAGAGTNNIPIDKCTDSGVVVFNTPGANANAVKEIVIAALLLMSRDIVGGIEWAKTLKGQEGVAAAVEKGKSNFAGTEILGKTLGIIGLGMIGVLVAGAAEALGMKVIGYDPYLSDENAKKILGATFKKTDNIDDIFTESDFITIHVPLNDGTKGTVRAETIAKMKDGVKILNFARGGLCDDADLAAALESGKVAAYITDFPNEKTLEMKNTLAVPHLGASTEEAEDNCAKMAVTQLQDYILNGNIKNSVNFPAVSMARNGGARVCVLYKGADTFAALNEAAARLGSTASVGKTKGENGYAIFDFASAPDTTSIASVDGVIKVRII